MPEKEIESAIEGILFAAGEPVPVDRIAAVLDISGDMVHAAAKKLADAYSFEQRGIRIVLLDGKLQMCSAPGLAETITRTVEQRRPQKLSQASLEVLAIVAYFQPVTRAYVEQIRGVDSSYTVGVLAERGLIEACGKLDVPGRPTLYKTSDAFLRIMGVSSLDELPELPDIASSEGINQLHERIEALSAGENVTGQIEISETDEPDESTEPAEE